MLCDLLTEPRDSERSDELAPPFWVLQILNVGVRCGRHLEAIPVPAVRARELLGPSNGPGRASAYAQTWYLPLSLDAVASDTWGAPRTQLLCRGTALGISAGHFIYGFAVRWVVLPGLRKTDPAALTEAVAGRVLAPRTAPRRSRRSASSCRQGILMCQHQPPCPTADATDRDAARAVSCRPEQGWTLLCNGVLAFEDTGELLPNGQIVEPFHARVSTAVAA
jgi:hypothetical protein